jgi:nucleolar complex protein 3
MLGRTPLADTAIHCMSILLAELTHFNFRQNLMAAVVARLSKRSWDEVSLPYSISEAPPLTALEQTSEKCLGTVNSVFRADQTGEASLEIVRILNRMIKERRFRIHPNVLSCLLNLRLRTELSVRASQTTADRRGGDDSSVNKKGKKQKKAEKPHLSKNAKKALKERKEIEKEMREAEAEVDKEERANTVRFLLVPSRAELTPWRITAYRNAETAVCVVLPDIEEPDSLSPPSRRPFGDLQVRPFGQHRVLP